MRSAQRLVVIALAISAGALLGSALQPCVAAAKKDAPAKSKMSAETFAGLKLRCLGPARISGRVDDFAVHPTRPWIYYVAVSSGNLWKTENAGTTFTPIFDDQGSFSIGCLALDPQNPLTIWVGTGENNSQRSVGYGDGVYKSTDGGHSWKNMGLKDSEHIGMIKVDPRNSNVLYVAAQGPLWKPGGDRGLYKTTDGSVTWTRVLNIGENTGVNEVHLDPRDPNILYASAYQRRRHVWTLIDGGPESAIHKSTNGGQTWDKLTNGLPKEDMGRIGLAVSPANPDVVYAIVEAANGAGGVFRSTDAGANWEKRSSTTTDSPQYYNELVADPVSVERVYLMDVRLKMTEDGGKTWANVGDRSKHVDNHALWIDPRDTDHLLNGCDGGVYESWDRGENWDFKGNLPTAQFYRVSADQAYPFYNVYGGTQDNASLRAPSRTISGNGITNADWITTTGGDGYETQVDPTDSNIIYAESQYGGLVRFDNRTGETIDIQPQPGKDDPPLRWNWDTPLLLSPHSPTRLYFAANRLFRTDDRGNSWRAISPDLTRQIDRNQLQVMGVIQSVDAVSKNWNTSFYGNCVALTESPLVAGLIYVGTDDGLIQVTEDAGATWRKIEQVAGVPPMSYVSNLTASCQDSSTVFAAFDNHKMGDFKPYVFRSDDHGRSWNQISGDLPERGTVYSLQQDHVNSGLLFAGTEFGVFFTVDGGGHWVRLKGGFPTIMVRDIEIQRRENDLVVGTFGRGIYVLDDYTPLRQITGDQLERQEAILFPVKDALLYHESSPWGGRGKAAMGDAFYYAENPAFGAVFTYYIKDEIKTHQKARREAEKKARDAGERIRYPGWDDLRLEDREKEPVILFTVTDETGAVVREITGPTSEGIHRVAWDLHYPSVEPASTAPWSPDEPWNTAPHGHIVAPGTYVVRMAKRVDDATTPLGTPQRFTVKPLGWNTLPTHDWTVLLGFQKQTADLYRSVQGAIRLTGEARTRVEHIQVALRNTPAADSALVDRARALELRLADLRIALEGDETISKRNEPIPSSVQERVGRIVWGGWGSTSDPTQTQRDDYAIAGEQFKPVLESLTRLVEVDLAALESDLEAAHAPWTPGRVPRWKQ